MRERLASHDVSHDSHGLDVFLANRSQTAVVAAAAGGNVIQ
jgi:hypothetical protein